MAGAMFLIATLLTIHSYRMIPGAVAWSITQLNVFWTVLVGVFIFKEVNYKQHWLRLITGSLMAVGACVLLFMAM
jgi:glucose uptake protein GlcU